MTPDREPTRTRLWYTVWTASKLLAVVLVAVPVAVLMITSSQPTVTPEAAAPATTLTTRTPSMPVTPGATPTPFQPTDLQVRGTIYYVKENIVWQVTGYAAAHRVAAGTDPSLSPDGSRLAVLAPTKNYDNVEVVTLHTGQRSVFVNDSPADPVDVRTGLSAAAPSWSLDGKTLFFSWSYPGAANPTAPGVYDRLDLSVTSCATHAPCTAASARQLSHPGFETGGDDEPTARPLDPTTLLYTSYAYQTVAGVPQAYGRFAVLNPVTGAFSGYFSPPTPSVLNPAWSPRGRYLAFVERSPDEQQTSLYVTTFHPAALSQQAYDRQDFDVAHLLLRGSPFLEHPVFSPDGHQLAYIGSGADGGLHIYIADVRLGKHSSITNIREVRRAGTVDGERLVWAR